MSADRLTVLVIAAVLIGTGALATIPRLARGSSESETPTGTARALDVLWTVVPIVFLVGLVILAARTGS